MTLNLYEPRTHDRPLLEVCVGSLDDALAAAAAGADRLELCGGLELGGLTPSIGLVQQVVDEIIEPLGLPIVVMLRPRAGGFAYSEAEFRCLLADAERVLEAGASGIVFGVLNTAGEIDEPRVERLVAAAGRETIFHRAFDGLAHEDHPLETLIRLGVTRVLTSGGPPTAREGTESLKRLVSQSAGRIELLPTGGITPADAPKILAATGCTQLHLGASSGKQDGSISDSSAAGLCDLQRLEAGAYRAVDPEVVKAAREAVG